MPENEFEKQVKDLMEEFHLSPSAPVWEKIKNSITKKKRRVWPIFFLFITIAIFSGYFFYADKKHSNQNTSKNYKAFDDNTSKKELHNNIKKESSNKKNSLSETQSLQPSAIKKINKTNLVSVTDNFRKDETDLTYQSLNKKHNAQIINDTAAYKKLFINILPVKPNNTNDLIIQQQTDSVHNFKDSLAKNNIDTSTKNNNEFAKSDSATQKTIQPKRSNKNKWQFGISAMYGRSTIADNFFNLSQEKSAQSSGLNNPGTVSGGSTSALKHPYTVAPAYNFNITVQRKISKQSSLNTGLNFVHLSSKSNTAISIDSSLVLIAADALNSSYGNAFYRAGSVKTYTNTFNFIELPVTFQSNLFHIKNFSVLYNAGASVMQLVSSKTLVYNNQNNSFFKNDALLRRTQFQLTAGLNLQLNTKNKAAFLLGPHFEYSLTPYLKNNNYNHLHYINYGVQATWFFK